LESPQTYTYPLNETNYFYNVLRFANRQHPDFAAKGEIPRSESTLGEHAATLWLHTYDKPGLETEVITDVPNRCGRMIRFGTLVHSARGTNWSFADGT
jgi:hypothetical protein